VKLEYAIKLSDKCLFV